MSASVGYSITSFAMASKVGGTVRPSAFAVVRLINPAEIAEPLSEAGDQTIL